MQLGGRIKQARDHMKWSAVDLAQKTGVANTTIGALEKRDSRRSEYAEALIAAFPADRISHDFLRTGRGTLTPDLSFKAMENHAEYRVSSNLKRVPVVGTARMGEDGYYEEMSTEIGAGDGHIEIQTADPNSYCLRVRGNSMHPAIRDGWYVLIEPNATPAVGEYVLIKMRDGQRMVKELLYQRHDSIEITSVNGDQRRTIYRDELDAIQAVGAVVSPSKWLPE